MPHDHDDLLAAAAHLTVPGTPLTLRLAGWYETPGAAPRVHWTFADPHRPSTPSDDGEGVHDVLEGVTAVHGDAAQTWEAVQLDAAWLFNLHLDEDWTPGVAPTRRRWSAEKAWDALLDFLGREGSPATVTDDVVRGPHLTLRGVTPESWAAYLNSVEDRDVEERGDGEDRLVVPVAVLPTGTGLPLWVDDELTWGFGDCDRLALVDGELVDDRPSLP